MSDGGQLAVVDLTRELLECARVALVEDDPGWNGRICMSPYSVPTRDECCGGALQGTIERYFPSSVFPQDEFELQPCNAGLLAADIVISVADCFVGMGPRGGARSCAELDDATDRITVQSAVVWSAVLCCLQPKPDVEWMFRSQTPFDNEQGGCIGSDLRITVGVTTGCGCG